MTRALTDIELEYLRSPRLGRLATVDRDGAPQNNPVGYRVGTVDRFVIGDYAMGASRKFRNLAHNVHVALVIDDLASTNPWTARGVEVRGTAEALTDVDPPMPGTSREVIRITPSWITSWGLEAPVP